MLQPSKWAERHCNAARMSIGCEMGQAKREEAKKEKKQKIKRSKKRKEAEKEKKKKGEREKKILRYSISLRNFPIHLFLGTNRLGFAFFRGPCGGGLFIG